MQTTYSDQEFVNRSIFIDGIKFERCRFVGCQLFYGAGDLTLFKDCEIIDCTWAFQGAAESVLAFLSSLFRETGPEGRNLVQTIFDALQEGRFLPESERKADVVPA